MDEFTKEYKDQDQEYKDYLITHVRDYGDQWELEVDNGWQFLVDKIEGHTPEVSHAIRFYGKGVGYAVRGVDIDYVTYYYRTPKQQEEAHQKYLAERDVESKASYSKNKDKYQEQYNSLPDILKKRIDRLITEKPDDRHYWEPYELFILTEATKIFNALKVPDVIEKFYDLSFDIQKKEVPDLDDGHSGYTFGCATRLAYQMAEGRTDL